ncbi:MAG: hypothetical protein IJH17_01950 [Clostridia bacterium]|nr:hypothetical protein [Clostridia bacterium]
MIYSNDDPMALYAMEAERTGNYGSDYYGDEDIYTPRCPVCGAYEPEYFYMNDDEECLGCTECVYRTEELF